jgi:hypothetical protein
LKRAETFSGVVFIEVEDDNIDEDNENVVKSALVTRKSFIKQRRGSFIRRSCDDCSVLENTGSLRTAAAKAINKITGDTSAFSVDSSMPSPSSVVSIGKPEEKKLLLRHTSHSHGLKLVSFERADSLLKSLENNRKPSFVKQNSVSSASPVTVLPLCDGKVLIPTRPTSAAPSRTVDRIPGYRRSTFSSSRRFANSDEDISI